MKRKNRVNGNKGNKQRKINKGLTTKGLQESRRKRLLLQNCLRRYRSFLFDSLITFSQAANFRLSLITRRKNLELHITHNKK
jgi:hypothetical protein